MSDKGIVCPSCGKPAKLASVVYAQQDTGWQLLAPPKEPPIAPFQHEQSKFGGCIWIPLIVLLIAVSAGLGQGFNSDTVWVIVGCLIAIAFGISTLPKAIARNKARLLEHEKEVMMRSTRNNRIQRQWETNIFYCSHDNKVFHRDHPNNTRDPNRMRDVMDLSSDL